MSNCSKDVVFFLPGKLRRRSMPLRGFAATTEYVTLCSWLYTP